MKYFLFSFGIVFLSLLCSAADQEHFPELLLANKYQPGIELQNYWVSEKLDGVRAFWDGKSLISRAGNSFRAPDWFTKPLPNMVLDGELWISRGTFEQVSSIVRRKPALKGDWRKIKYMIFDLPGNSRSFDHRLTNLKQLIKNIGAKHIQVIEQFKVPDHETLMNKLEYVVEQGGEGLMLHAGASYYQSGRSDDLLKLKKYSDAEAVVIKHYPGKGKYSKMLGSILVETPDKIRFKIGSGFSDRERKNPPAIGTIITYKYTGLTKNGVPRFASFLRIRQTQ